VLAAALGVATTAATAAALGAEMLGVKTPGAPEPDAEAEADIQKGSGGKE
jgi:hypothetical protein